MSSVFGRVSGCQRPIPSLYINYYLCHCNGRLHSDARVAALHCGRPVHISSVGRFASDMQPVYRPPSVHRPLLLPLFPGNPSAGKHSSYAGLTRNRRWQRRVHLPPRKFSCAQRLKPGCLRDFSRRTRGFAERYEARRPSKDPEINEPVIEPIMARISVTVIRRI